MFWGTPLHSAKSLYFGGPLLKHNVIYGCPLHRILHSRPIVFREYLSIYWADFDDLTTFRFVIMKFQVLSTGILDMFSHKYLTLISFLILKVICNSRNIFWRFHTYIILEFI